MLSWASFADNSEGQNIEALVRRSSTFLLYLTTLDLLAAGEPAAYYSYFLHVIPSALLRPSNGPHSIAASAGFIRYGVIIKVCKQAFQENRWAIEETTTRATRTPAGT